MTPQTFHPFPLLPIEIRLKIWTWSLPRPRFLEYDELQYEPNHPNPPARLIKPVTLNVNQESRQLALRYFSKPLDTRRDCVDFENDYFFQEGLPAKGIVKEKWAAKFAIEDVEKIENLVLEYRRFEKCRIEFKATALYYIDHVLPNLKGIMLHYHIIEPLLRTVAMDFWKLDNPVVDDEKSQEILAPMKMFAEEMLEGIRKEKERKGERWRVINVGVRDCKVCKECMKLARCHAAQKAFRARRKKERDEREERQRGIAQRESSAMGALGGGIAAT